MAQRIKSAIFGLLVLAGVVAIALGAVALGFMLIGLAELTTPAWLWAPGAFRAALWSLGLTSMLMALPSAGAFMFWQFVRRVWGRATV